jgi:predicted ATPase/DNA-binding winged helix-turn-helix (wHTH) protein
MVKSTPTSGEATFLFGPFEFHPTQRVLMRAGKPLRIGSRAREILLALLESAGIIVEKKALIVRVWRDILIQEGTLRVHVAELRKLLSDGQNGPGYIENISGIGYRFSAPVTRSAKPQHCEPAQSFTSKEPADLSVALTRPVGRAARVSGLACRLPSERFVTIVGPGGIGKTTVALATAHQLQPSYVDGIHFIDFGLLTDGALIPAVLAARLGLARAAENPMAQIAAFLKDKRMLILLDNCEHVVSDTAVIAEQLLGASNVHVLATSREPLRARGEHVLRLEPLALPPRGATVTAAEALGFSAIELFVERSMASLDTFQFGDDDVATVAHICRRLDGLPLAIELAAARVEQFGLRGLAARLGGGLGLLNNNRRTAISRQRTLRATLDWSYNLLSPVEQLALHRLAIFPGSFGFGSASQVIVDEALSAAAVLDVIPALVTKSLVTAHTSEQPARYRLSHLLRAYALEKLKSSDEYAQIRRRYPLAALQDIGLASQLHREDGLSGGSPPAPAITADVDV